MESSNSVLVVDLDGTLVSTDALVESGLDFLHQHPAGILRLPGWLRSGKAMLKQSLANNSSLCIEKLPYNDYVLELIRQAKQSGKRVVLATASDQAIARAVADHLGCFDEVIASDGGTNLSAARKRDALVQRFGVRGFDYIGNSSDDLLVWQASEHAILIDTPARVARAARRTANVSDEYSTQKTPLLAFLKALRPHQWAKNGLIFVPLMTAHAFSVDALGVALLAFVCFCLVASGTYLINDLLDIQDDRQHPSKCKRPFAAATLDPLTGIWSALLLVAVGVLLGVMLLPPLFVLSLIAYLVITLAYSLVLKSMMAVDVITLTVLYTLRIVAGSVAIETEPTFWILTFSLFIFLSLALVKRFAELQQARNKGETGKSAGRGYYPSDMEMVAAMGVGNGYLSILFFALYIQDAATIVLYSHPQWLWLICPVLMYWVTRLWLLTHRGEMHDDPVVFAIKDKVSLVTLLMIMAVFGAAI
jgi:4-hydroxybenzoate polyprenyltransferase|tara:strand:+ start:1238 stop:2665 length:1428 start_codon:yes stop_codon:yes gene_type:complete